MSTAGRDVAWFLDGRGERRLAFGTCGRAAAVVRTYDDGGEMRFAAVLDPAISRDCPVEVLLVEAGRIIRRVGR